MIAWACFSGVDCGSFSLATVYSPVTTASQTSAETLLPVSDHRHAYSCLLRAVENRVADEFAWERAAALELEAEQAERDAKADGLSDRQEPRATQNEPTTVPEEGMVEEGELEDGAEVDEVKFALSPARSEHLAEEVEIASHRFRPKRLRHVIRFGQGILLLPRLPAATDARRVFVRGHGLVCATFRIHLASDSLLVQIQPARTAFSQLCRNGPLREGTEIVLAPFDRPAVFVRSLEDSLQPECGDPARDALAAALEEYGVSEALLEQGWVICKLPLAEQVEKSAEGFESELSSNEFVWPAALCLVHDQNSSSHGFRSCSRAATNLLTHRTSREYVSIPDLAARTVSLLQQLTVAQESPSASNDAGKEDAVDTPRAATWQNMGDTGSLSGDTPRATANEKLSVAPSTPLSLSSALPGQSPAAVSSVSDTGGQAALTVDAASAKAEPQLSAVSETQQAQAPGMGPGPATATADESRRGSAFDFVWGELGSLDTSGAGARVDEKADSNARTRRDDEDDDPFSGMGLVTEDDFSFFDDGTFDFAPMDVDPAGNAEVQQTAPALAENPGPETQTGGAVPTIQAGRGENFLFSNEDASAATRSDLPVADSMVTPSAGGPTHQIASDTPSSSIRGHAGYVTSDPPSLPGFTPGSLTASSPAVGGQVAKTPRTPFSPYEELADHAVTIEGDAYGPVFRTADGTPNFATRSGAAAHEHLVALDGTPHPSWSDESGKSALVPLGFQALLGKQQHHRRALDRKYDQGKFAIPVVPSLREGTASTTGTQRWAANGQAQQGTLARQAPGSLLHKRIQHQARSQALERSQHSLYQPGLRRSAGADAVHLIEAEPDEPLALRGASHPTTLRPLPTLSMIHKLHLAGHQRAFVRGPDEDGSDFGTAEETASDATTFRDEDSEDEESDEESEDEDVQALEGLLRTSLAVLQTCAFRDRSALRGTPLLHVKEPKALPLSSGGSLRAKERQRTRSTLIDWLVHSPQLRLVLGAEDETGPTEGSAFHTARLSALDHADLSDGLWTTFCPDPTDPSQTSNNLHRFTLAPTLSQLLSSESNEGSSESSAPLIDYLEPPSLLVGCQGAVTRMASSATRFWTKMALCPVGGPKNVRPFVLRAQAPSASPPGAGEEEMVTAWLKRVRQAYEVSLGTRLARG